MGTNLGVIGITINLIDNFSPKLLLVAKSLDKFGATTRKYSQNLGLLGASLTAGFTMPLVKLIKITADFEHQFANVVKTVQGFDVDPFGKLNPAAQKFKDHIRELARTLPFTHKELSEIAAFGGQFGVSASRLGEFTSVVAKLGTAVDGIEAETAAKGLAQIANITGISNVEKGFERLASTLVDLGNKGISTEGTILEITRRMSGAGAMAKMKAEDMMGMAAAVANLGHRSELGGNALANTVLKISRAVSKGGKDLENFARVSGKSSKEFADDWGKDATKGLMDLLGNINKLDSKDIPKTIAALFGTGVRQNSVLLSLIQTYPALLVQMDNARNAYRENNALQEEFRKKATTTVNQLKVVGNQFMDLAMTIGGPFLDVIKRTIAEQDHHIESLRRWAQAFEDMSPAMQSTIVKFTLFLASLPLIAVGISAVTYTFGQLWTVIGGLGKAIAWLLGAAGEETVWAKWGTSITNLSTKITTLIRWIVQAVQWVFRLAQGVRDMTVIFQGIKFRWLPLAAMEAAVHSFVGALAGFGILAGVTAVLSDFRDALAKFGLIKKTIEAPNTTTWQSFKNIIKDLLPVFWSWANPLRIAWELAKKMFEMFSKGLNAWNDILAKMGLTNKVATDGLSIWDQFKATVSELIGLWWNMLNPLRIVWEIFKLIDKVMGGSGTLKQRIDGVKKHWESMSTLEKTTPLGAYKTLMAWANPVDDDTGFIDPASAFARNEKGEPYYAQPSWGKSTQSSWTKGKGWTSELSQREGYDTSSAEAIKKTMSEYGDEAMRTYYQNQQFLSDRRQAALEEEAKKTEKLREEQEKLDKAFEKVAEAYKAIGYDDFVEWTNMNESLKILQAQGLQPTAEWLTTLGDKAIGTMKFLEAMGIPIEAMPENLKKAAETSTQSLKQIEDAFAKTEEAYNAIGLDDFKTWTNMTESLKILQEQGLKPSKEWMEQYGDAAAGARDYMLALGIPLEAMPKMLLDAAKAGGKFNKELKDFDKKLSELKFEIWAEQQVDPLTKKIGELTKAWKDQIDGMGEMPKGMDPAKWQEMVSAINKLNVDKLIRAAKESKAFANALRLVAMVSPMMAKAIKEAADSVGGIEEKKEKEKEDNFGQKSQKIIKDMASSFSKLANIMGDSFKGPLQYMGQIVGQMNVGSEIGEQMANNWKTIRDYTKGTRDENGKLVVSAGNAAAAYVGMALAIAQGYGAMMSATDVAGKGNRMIGGAATGASIGMAFGPWGAVAGAVVGAIWGAVRKVPWEEIGKRIGQRLGVNISEELSRKIQADAKKFGGDWKAAEVYNLGNILKEGGGLNTENLGKFTAELRDAFVMFEEGKFNATELNEVLDSVWDQFQEESTNSLGFINAGFRDIIDLAVRFGAQSDKVKNFFKQQADGLIEAVNILGKMPAGTEVWHKMGETIKSTREEIDALNKAPMAERDSKWIDDMAKATKTLSEALVEQAAAAEKAEAEMNSLGIVIAGNVWASVAAGKSLNQAMKDAGEGLNDFFTSMEALGLTHDDPLVNILKTQWELQRAIPNTIMGVDALGSSIAGLANMGLLTEESFGAIQNTAFAAYTSIQGEVARVGGTTRDALLPMQTYLQQAAYAAKEFGIPLEENTKMMIDQSKELGIWKELGPSAMDKMISALTTMIGKMDTLLSKLFGLPDSVPDPFADWEVPGVPAIPGGEPPPGTPGYATGTMGVHGKWFQNFGSEQLAKLHNNEAVITPGQAVPFARSILGAQSAYSSANMSGGGGGGVTPVTLLVKNHKVFTEVVTEGQDEFLASRGVRR